MTADDESIVDEVAKRLPKMSAEQKLWGLRNDALGITIRISAIAELLRAMDLQQVEGLPEDVGKWIEQLNAAVHDLRETLDKYTTTD